MPARKEAKIESHEGSSPASRLRRAPSPGALGLIAALAAMALYLPSLDYGWVWDDQFLVTSRAAGGVGAIGFRPLASLLYRMDWAIGYGAPMMFHLTGILLHGLATWLFFRLARGVGLKSGIALGAALLFAAHPVHVEAVAYISGRPALLATVFSLAALLLARSPELCRPEGCRSWKIWPAYAAMAAALLCEETALVTPLILVGLDRWGPTRVPWRGRLVHYSGFAALALVYLLVRFAAPGAAPSSPAGAPQAALGSAAAPLVAGSSVEARGIAREARAWAVPMAAGEYLRMLVVPHPLNAMRSFKAEDAASNSGRAATALTFVAFALLIAWRWRDPVGRAGALLLVLPLLPSLPLPGSIGGYAEERSIYYASVGFCLLVGSLYAWLAGTNAPRLTTPLVAVLLAGAAGLGTIARLPVWRSNTRLLEAAVAADPRDQAPHFMLARIYMTEDHWESALAEMDLAIAIRPDDAAAVQMRTAILSRLGRWADSAASARRAIELNPMDATSWANLGDALNQEGKTQDAVTACRQAVAIDSTLVNGWYNLGVALGNSNDPPGAAAAYERAIALQPDNVLALNNLAAIYGASGRLEEARDLYLRMVGLAPRSVEGHMNLALAYLRLGDRENAAAERALVRKLNPNAVRQLDQIFQEYQRQSVGGAR